MTWLCLLQEKDLFVSCPYNLEQLNAKRNREKDKIHQVHERIVFSCTHNLAVKPACFRNYPFGQTACSLLIHTVGPIRSTPGDVLAWLYHRGWPDYRVITKDSSACVFARVRSWLSAIIVQIQQIEKTSNSKTEPFLLSMDWVNKWKSFIQCNTLGMVGVCVCGKGGET